MHACMHACMHGMHVCMSVCMHVCPSVCLSVCMYVYVCVCMCMYVYVCVCMCMYVYVCVRMCMYVCMHVCMYCMAFAAPNQADPYPGQAAQGPACLRYRRELGTRHRERSVLAGRNMYGGLDNCERISVLIQEWVYIHVCKYLQICMCIYIYTHVERARERGLNNYGCLF